jgi:hypothetical protein
MAFSILIMMGGKSLPAYQAAKDSVFLSKGIPLTAAEGRALLAATAGWHF